MKQDSNSTALPTEKMDKYLPDTRNILKRRAAALAAETGDDDDKGSMYEVVEFLLAFELYGIKSSFVQEVYPLKDFAPLPGTPPFLVGITNIRGRIVSVVDIKKLFNLPDKGITDLNRVIIIEHEGNELGILADRIMGIRNMKDRDFAANKMLSAESLSSFIHGVTDDRLILLDVEKIFADKRLIINAEL